MNLPTLGIAEFQELILTGRRLIDVRAPVEFEQGSIPGSVNLPIMDNSDREIVGTVYKRQGQDAAIAKGHELVSGEIREKRISAWLQEIQKHPQAMVTCFRGGLRSKTTQKWLADRGIQVPRIEGGYKALRGFLMKELEARSGRKFLVVSGATGSGKSLLIQDIQSHRPTLDLERMAHHRGSAFGGYLVSQPTQINFENEMSTKLLKIDLQESTPGFGKDVVVEDESRMVGRCVIPESFFGALRASPVVLVEETLESRVKVTFEDYILKVPDDQREAVFEKYQRSLEAISKKLGGLRFQEVQGDLNFAILQSRQGVHDGHRLWIEKLLVWYYDPLYTKSFESRRPKVLFKGSRCQVLDFLKS